MLACGLIASAVFVVQVGNVAGAAGSPLPLPLLAEQVGAEPATPSVTYTPIRRPGATSPPIAAPKVVPDPHAPAAPVNPPPAPVAPVYLVPAAVAPAYAPSPSAATTWALPTPSAPAPLQSPPALPPVPPNLSIGRANAEPAATVSAKAVRPAKEGHRYLGLATDVGMPDGLNLGLVLDPADWLRLVASLGTNSASLNYRGGVSFIPVGWGPSFTLEAGHCNTAPTTSVIRTFFTVPTWVKQYVQQLGYTYVNAHVGFDYRVGGLTLFIHGGGTYLMGTVRAPDPIVVDASTNTTVKIAQDGRFSAYTLSAKAGLVYMFGGP
jgi:hypothetical protein